MKKAFTILSIALISTTAQAETSVEAPKAFETISDAAQTKEASSNLWEILDTNKDGSLSKIEASRSKDIFDNWDKLNLNNDKKLDTEEFAQIFSQEK